MMMAKKQENQIKEKKLVTEAYLDMRLDGLKEELKEEIAEEMRGETVKILHAVDAVMTRFDVTEKEEAAHTGLHERITDTFHEHDRRIGRLEARTAK